MLTDPGRWAVRPLAVALFDGALSLVATNARYRDLTGLDVAQASGRPIYDQFDNFVGFRLNFHFFQFFPVFKMVLYFFPKVRVMFKVF